MYPGKKSGMTWLMQIFFGISVLVFIGAVAFGIMVTRDDGAGFQNLFSDDSGNTLSVGK